MISRSTQVANEEADQILRQIDPNLLIPELYLVTPWIFGSKDLDNKITINYLYLKHAEPRFDLDALYECFKSYFRGIGIDPGSKVSVGGSLHKYEKKPILTVSSFTLNPNFLDQRYRTNCRHISAQKLTVRFKNNGFTLCFWALGCALYIYKNFQIRIDPKDLVRKFLIDLDYPKFVIRERLRHEDPSRFRFWYNNIGHSRNGWCSIQL